MFKRPQVLLMTLLLTLAAADANASPDRCATLGEDGYPAWCEPISEELAWDWGHEVCCEGETCELSRSGACPDVAETFSCKYARVDALGHATCQFIVPNYCDLFACEPVSAMPEELPPLYTFGPFMSAVCCYEEGCYSPLGGPCGGYLTWCDNGVTNESGTVTCFDEYWPW